MPTRSAEATWNGNLKEGNGNMRLGGGAYEGSYTYKSRFEEGDGTNPEELIGAAHAGCFSMALSGILTEAGHTPDRIHTTAQVHLEKGAISRIELTTEGDAPGLSQEDFQKHAETAKQNCPVSKALAGTDISVKATLRS